MHKYTKAETMARRYRTYTVHTFWGSLDASALRYLGVDHFHLHTYSAQSIYPFWLATGRIQKDSERMEGSREAFIQKVWKENLVLLAVPKKEFRQKKIHNKDAYVDYGATEDIPKDVWCLS